MRIEITSLGAPQTSSVRDEIKVSRFPVTFECETCSGDAQLCVIHSSSKMDIQAIRTLVLTNSLECEVSFDTMRNFNKAPYEHQNKAVACGLPGAFAFEGLLKLVLHTGEGYVFCAGAFEFMIPINSLPKVSADIGEGSWVSFEVEGLSFWVR